jgi:Rieske Fe-S protein
MADGFVAADLSRRAVLAGLGVSAAAGAAALTGCSTYRGGSTPTSTGQTNSGPVDLGSTGDIPVGGGKIFDTQLVVVTQPAAGQFKCFSAICTHQGCTVGTVQGGTINCPCHGSRYNIKDGSVVNGPAPKPLPAKQITVSGGQITLDA